MKGCLGFVGLMVLFCAWIVGYVFYVYFGPSNPLIGFVFGAAMMATMLFLFDRGLPHAEVGTRGATPLPDDNLTQSMRFAALWYGKVVGWALTLLCGGLSLLCVVFAVAMIFKGEDSAGALGAFSGTLAVLAYFVWNYLAKANSA